MTAGPEAAEHAAAGTASDEGKTISHSAARGTGSQGSQRSLLVAWGPSEPAPLHANAQSPDPTPAPPNSVAGTPSPNAVPPLPPRRKNVNPSEPGGAPPATGAAAKAVAQAGSDAGSFGRPSGPPSRTCSPASTPPSSFSRSPSSGRQSPAATGGAPELLHSHHLSAPNLFSAQNHHTMAPKRRGSYKKVQSFPLVLNPLAEDNVWPLPISAESARALRTSPSPADALPAEDAPPPAPPPRRRTEIAAEIATEIAAEIAAAAESSPEPLRAAPPPPPRGGQQKRLAAAAMAAASWEPFSPPPLLPAPAPPPRRSRSRKASGDDMALYGEAAAQAAEPGAAHGAASSSCASSSALSSAGQSEEGSPPRGAGQDLAGIPTSLQSPPGVGALLSLGQWEDAHALRGGGGGGGGVGAADAAVSIGRQRDSWDAKELRLQPAMPQKAALPQRRHSWTKGIPIADGDDVGDAAVDVGI